MINGFLCRWKEIVCWNEKKTIFKTFSLSGDTAQRLLLVSKLGFRKTLAYQRCLSVQIVVLIWIYQKLETIKSAAIAGYWSINFYSIYSWTSRHNGFEIESLFKIFSQNEVILTNLCFHLTKTLIASGFSHRFELERQECKETINNVDRFELFSFKLSWHTPRLELLLFHSGVPIDIFFI